jgi:hypothetical protein
LLQTLKHRSPAEAAAILASLTLSLSSEAEHSIEDSIDENLRSSLLSEVYRKLHISHTAQSESQKAELYRFLTKEMSNAALSATDTDEIKKRVGQRGDLRPDLYSIEIPPEARSLAKERLISLGEITSALEQPHEVEHLLSGVLSSANSENAISVYSQEQETVSTGEHSVLLVLSRRMGYHQQIMEPIRIYPSDVHINDVISPLDLLKAFIEKYGFELKVAGRTGKFFLYETLPYHGDFTKLVEYPPEFEKETKHRTCLLVKLSVGKVEVALVYSINEGRYLADLQKHRSVRR